MDEKENFAKTSKGSAQMKDTADNMAASSNEYAARPDVFLMKGDSSNTVDTYMERLLDGITLEDESRE